ncbi:MAG: hydrolase, partial [Planctomycetota bacterium]|nr:hydrolase [Planctomycetota bacterium]
RTHDSFLNASAKQFAGIWDKYFRGTLPVAPASAPREVFHAKNLVLFGDPASNPLIADILPQLPITWTKDRLVMNGVEYDAKSHIPVLIYPNPKNRRQYVVLNSGHTFREPDLKGTNALLYPRLGDWAVIKPTPTAADPTAYEVVAAGLFDEDWKFVPSK